MKSAMMFQKQATVFVALILGMALMMLDTAHACSCLALPGLCDYYDAADVVVHGKVVSRSSESTVSYSSSVFPFPTSQYEYTIDIITLYKDEPDIVYDQQMMISFFTGTSSAACGIAPEIDGEYLFGLNWSGGSSDSTDDGELGATLCGLFRDWSNVDEDELEGCTSDACDGACDEFEECLQYEKNERWYCSEICADGACDVGESCKTKSRFWCKFSSYDGCPQRRVCY